MGTVPAYNDSLIAGFKIGGWRLVVMETSDPLLSSNMLVFSFGILEMLPL